MTFPYKRPHSQWSSSGKMKCQGAGNIPPQLCDSKQRLSLSNLRAPVMFTLHCCRKKSSPFWRSDTEASIFQVTLVNVSHFCIRDYLLFVLPNRGHVSPVEKCSPTAFNFPGGRLDSPICPCLLITNGKLAGVMGPVACVAKDNGEVGKWVIQGGQDVCCRW